ncbi:hypothetical protein MRB53_020686 [Persea americana]|uniref:Uncharacterized protein n=1 Tax=Persea americana TaxID=3435 RepID=A0ACC2L1Q9_PERAE|nr:hypothetical protein MRB53_020686 [Persea americana]
MVREFLPKMRFLGDYVECICEERLSVEWPVTIVGSRVAYFRIYMILEDLAHNDPQYVQVMPHNSLLLDDYGHQFIVLQMDSQINDQKGMSGEAPRHELRKHGQISGARFDATWGVILGLKVRGRDYNTTAGTCIRDYIDVTDLVYAHVKVGPKKVGIQCWHGQSTAAGSMIYFVDEENRLARLLSVGFSFKV